MRILQIHNFYKQTGGEDTVFYNEYKILTSHGHRVEQLIFDNKSIDSTISKLRTFFGTFYNIKSKKLVEDKIKTFQPEVIHVHNFFPLVSPSIIYAATKYVVPIVFTLHNYRLICPSSTLYYNGRLYLDSINKIFPLRAISKKLYRDSFLQTLTLVLMTGVHKIIGTWKNVDTYIVMTKFSKDIFMNSSLNLPFEKIVIKPHSTDKLSYSKNEKEDHFLFIGRLTQEKGISTLIKAFSNKKLKLKIIGDGPLINVVKEQSINNENIEYLGFKNKVQIIEQLRICKALIFPSEWYETFGMTIIEAFSVGTPVIASNIGGIPELVVNKYNGLLFETNNHNDLTDKLLSLSALNQEELSLNAYNSFISKYSDEINLKSTLSIYEGVIQK